MQVKKIVDYEVLTEANLNRIVNSHDEKGYIIISASRQDAVNKENPTEEETFAENNKRTNDLRNKISLKGYSYLPVYGGYKEEGSSKAHYEKSFIVFPYNYSKKEYVDFEQFFDEMVKLGVEYNQDAILVKKPNEAPKYYDPAKKDWVSRPFNSVTLNDVQREYFTALKSWQDTSLNKSGKDTWEGSPKRFSYTETYIDKQPQTIMGRHSRSSVGELLLPW